MIKTMDEIRSDLTFNDSKVDISLVPVDAAWARMQFTLECCGVGGFGDYEIIATNFSTRYTIPGLGVIESNVAASCCKLTGKPRIPDDVNEFLNLAECLKKDRRDTMDDGGCYVAVERFIKKYSDMVSAVLGSVAAVELILVIFTVCLCRADGINGKSIRAVNGKSIRAV